jgi:anaerobic selenocysteine-containing dehydrogenase
MGITQQHNGVEMIYNIVNLLLMKGSIGIQGGGACPVRVIAMYRETGHYLSIIIPPKNNWTDWRNIMVLKYPEKEVMML